MKLYFAITKLIKITFFEKCPSFLFELIIYEKGDTFKPTASKHTVAQLK